MKIKTAFTAALAGASLLALAPGVSHATAYDTDTVAAQTTGATARGPVAWTTASGYGSYSITLSDTSATDGACVKLEARRRYASGVIGAWGTIGSVCGGGYRTTFNGGISPNGGDAVRVLDFKVTRLGGFNNSDVYSVSPGGA